MADKNQNLVKYGEVIAKCWEDEAYRKRFIEDPESVLSEAGFVVEEGVTYKVVEQPKNVKYLVLPHADAKDAVQNLTKAFLNQVEQRDVIIPDGAEVRIIQNTDDTRYMVLPASPKSLTKSELAAAAGGDSVFQRSDHDERRADRRSRHHRRRGPDGLHHYHGGIRGRSRRRGGSRSGFSLIR